MNIKNIFKYTIDLPCLVVLSIFCLVGFVLVYTLLALAIPFVWALTNKWCDYSSFKDMWGLFIIDGIIEPWTPMK